VTNVVKISRQNEMTRFDWLILKPVRHSAFRYVSEQGKWRRDDGSFDMSSAAVQQFQGFIHPSYILSNLSIATMKSALIALLSLSSALAFTIPSSQQSSATRLFSAATEDAAAEATSSKTGKEISAATAGRQVVFTSEQIDELLPHRYPFALVDKVVEYEAGKRAVGIKSVTKVSTHE
jgi:hypothetical protein